VQASPALLRALRRHPTAADEAIAWLGDSMSSGALLRAGGGAAQGCSHAAGAGCWSLAAAPACNAGHPGDPHPQVQAAAALLTSNGYLVISPRPAMCLIGIGMYVMLRSME
jgi:hypothetical protein